MASLGHNGGNHVISVVTMKDMDIDRHQTTTKHRHENENKIATNFMLLLAP